VLSRFFRDDVPALQKMYSDSLRLFVTLMIPLVIAMVFFSREFVLLLLGERFLPAVPAFRLLSLVFGIMFISTLQLWVLTATDRQHLTTLCIAIALMTNLVLDILLIPGMGFMGAAWGTFFAETALVAASFFFVSRSLARPWAWKIIYGPCTGGLLMGLFCLGFRSLGPWAKLTLAFPSSLIIYLGHVLLTRTLTREEIQSLWGSVGNLLRKKQEVSDPGLLNESPGS
jgi:O-antigen/teichoic acid export membrane protein